MPHNVKKNRRKRAVVAVEPSSKNEKAKERAALYVRASSEGQVEGQEISTLDAQLAACRAFAQSRGWEIVVEKEEKRSGRSLDKRSEFLSILDLIKNGQIQHLVVKSLSRLSRSVQDYCEIAKLVSEAGASIWIVDQPALSAGGATGDLVLHILAAVSEFESQMISERVKSKNQHYFNLGLPASHPAIGYKWCDDKNHTWVIDDQEASLVKTIFQMYCQFRNMPKLLEWLKDNGIKTPKGKNFIVSAIHKILTNRAYIGECYWEPQGWYQGKHEPIISVAQYDMVQQYLENTQKSQGTSKTHDFVFILPNLVYGAGEDSDGNQVWVPLVPDWTERKQADGSKRRHFYYRSRLHRRKINNAKCSSQVPNLPADILEERVLQAIEERYSETTLNADFFDEIKISTGAKEMDTHQKINMCEGKIRRLREEILSLTRLLGKPDPELNKEVLLAVNQNVEKISAEIAVLENEREYYLNLLTIYEHAESNAEYFKDLLRRLMKAHSVKDRRALREIMAILVARVYVSNDELQVEVRVLPEVINLHNPWLGSEMEKLPRADSNHQHTG